MCLNRIAARLRHESVTACPRHQSRCERRTDDVDRHSVVLVLRRRGCTDQCGIDNRAALELCSPRLQHLTHFREDPLAQLVLIQQMPEFEQRGSVRNRFAAKVDANEMSVLRQAARRTPGGTWSSETVRPGSSRRQKGGLAAATRALAIEYAKRGIRVNAVSPGMMKTPMFPPDLYAKFGALHPMGHMGEMSDIVEAILYLDSAPFVTGE